MTLNNILHSGPNLQGDLFAIILNYRLHAVAKTADCGEQFLQIIMREADRQYQRFSYHFKPLDPLVTHPLWLHGPPWSSLQVCQWPLKSLDNQSSTDIPEQKVVKHTLCIPSKQCALYELALRASSWSKLLRVVVYVCKFTKLIPRRNTTAMTADDLNATEST